MAKAAANKKPASAEKTKREPSPYNAFMKVNLYIYFYIILIKYNFNRIK